MLVKIRSLLSLETKERITRLRRELYNLQNEPIFTETIRLTEVDKTVRGTQNCIAKGIDTKTGKIEYFTQQQIIAISGK